jgi:hypothetical protein
MIAGCAKGQRRKAMALPFDETTGVHDSRSVSILAKTIYRELRNSGFDARDVVALAGELLGQVTSEVRSAGNRALELAGPTE